MDISDIKIEPEPVVEIDQSLLDDLLAYKSKPRKPNPPEKPGFFCVLCLRRCPPKLVVKFAPCSNSKAVDPVEANRKLKQALGLELNLEKHTACAMCWKLVNLIGDFKVCCSKAVSNVEMFPTGLSSENRRDDGWMAAATLDWIVQSCKIVWKHMELIDAQVEVAHSKSVQESAAPAVIFVVPDRELKASGSDGSMIGEDVRQKLTVVDQLLKKFPKDLMVKRTRFEHAKDTENRDPPKNESSDSDQECFQNEIMDDTQSSTVSGNDDSAKDYGRDIEDNFSILNESKTIGKEEAALLDLLATKSESAKPSSKTNILEKAGPSRTRSGLGKKKKEVAKAKKQGASLKTKSGEIVTCVQSGAEMLRFLEAKPATPKIFTKRGVLNKEHQVQVKNLYEVLDVLSTSKISTEDEVVALDLLATKAKIANPKRNKQPIVRPAEVNELTDAALDDYMASVDEKIIKTGRKKSQAAEEAKHLEKDHYQVTICTCDICGRNFDGQHAVNVHKMHCTPESPANEKYVSCPICTATFLDNSGLTFHINRHKGIRPYKCRKFCDNTFFSNYTRIKHERKFCEREGRVCSICGLQLKNEASLTSHTKTVHGEAKFECQICGQKFRSRKNFIGHKLVHSDERKHRCPHCDKAFKVARSLKVHQRIHTDSLPFACHMCEQRFNYKVSLRSHIERHHGPNDRW